MSVLKVNEVSKAFENEKIIENISLELHEGEIVSLLGVTNTMRFIKHESCTVLVFKFNKFR